MSLGVGMRPFASVCPASRESISDALRQQAAGISMVSIGSGVWPAANLAIYLPFELEVASRLRQLGAINGATASGNLDVGIYSAGGELLISAGSTAQAGTTAIQLVNVADTDLPPGLYYLALVLDNGTGTNRRVSGYSAVQLESVGVLQEAAAFPLPASMTPVIPTNAYLPYALAQFGRLV